MKIGTSGSTIAISAAPADLDVVRGIPHRWWSQDKKLWYAPVTPRSVQYLKRFTNPEQTDILNKAEGLFLRHPLPSTFTYKTKPYPHQEEALERMQDLAAFALFMEPGLGKSKVIIDDANLAYLQGKIEAQAVVCPNSIKSNWADEILVHSTLDADVCVYSPERKKQVRAWIAKEIPGKVKWFVIGVETLSSGEGRVILAEFLKHQRTGLGIDESSRIKTWNANRTKVLHALGPLSVRRRIATGTPITKGLQDAWAQYEFLDPLILCQNFYAYRNHFCILGGHTGKAIVASKNEDEYIDRTAFHTIVSRKIDCLNLPEKVYQVRKVEPSEAQKKAYQDLTRTGMTEVEQGIMSFPNVLVKQLRLQQVCGGFLAVEEKLENIVTDVDALFAALERGETPAILKKAEKTKCIPIEGENPKIEELKAIIDETPGKMIIFCRFRPEIDAIQKALQDLDVGEVEVFHGDCDDDQRTTARRRFQNDPAVRFIILQESTGGIGITLTAAQTVVYFSNSWSLEDRIQSEDRAHRIGQIGTVVYIDLVLDIAKSVDARVHASLKAGKSYTDTLMEQMKGAVNGAA